MATKNAHVFASSSFGFGYILIFSNRKKEDNTTATTTKRETRDEKGKEGGEEEEEDVLRLFVFFSEFRRGVVFVSRVESKRG